MRFKEREELQRQADIVVRELRWRSRSTGKLGTLTREQADILLRGSVRARRRSVQAG